MSDAHPMLGAVGEMRPIEFVVPRSWRERLFSRPWRPHHNAIVFTGKAVATALRQKDADTHEMSWKGVGTLARTTAYRMSRESWRLLRGPLP